MHPLSTKHAFTQAPNSTESTQSTRLKNQINSIFLLKWKTKNKSVFNFQCAKTSTGLVSNKV